MCSSLSKRIQSPTLVLSLVVAAGAIAPPGPSFAQGMVGNVPRAGTRCFVLLVDSVPTGPRIISTRQLLRVSFGDGEVTFVEGQGTEHLMPGETMQVVRPSGLVRHPATGDVLGQALEIMGTLEILEVLGERALGRVAAACREMEVGDFLRPLPSERLPAFGELPPFDIARLVEPMESDATVVLGAVESVSSDVAGTERRGLTSAETYAQGDLVTIDQGRNAGWSVGDLALIFRDRVSDFLYTAGVPQPPLVVGRGLVVGLEATSAIVQVTDGDYPVELGNRARRIGSALAPQGQGR